MSVSSFLKVDKELIQKFGLLPAVFLSNLIDKYTYFQKRSMLKTENWFYLTHEQQTEQTGIKLKQLRNCKRLFKENGIIKTKKMGIPAKEYYQINIKKLWKELPIKFLDKPNKPLKKHNYKSSWGWEDVFPKEWLTPKFLKLLCDFGLHRTEKRKPITKPAAKVIARKLQVYSIEIATIALNQSIECGWTGIFPKSVKLPELTQKEYQRCLEDNNGRSTKELYQRYLQTPHWQTFRLEIHKLLENKCHSCKATSNLHIHHNNYDNLWKETEADVILLCSECHSKHHDIPAEAAHE